VTSLATAIDLLPHDPINLICGHEITIDTQTIKIFDGLYQPFLDWKDHVIRAMRKCMLVDPFVVLSSAQFNADTAVYEIVGCGRKSKECVNGYDIIIAMQK
jgi:hypothetical protein